MLIATWLHITLAPAIVRGMPSRRIHPSVLALLLVPGLVAGACGSDSGNDTRAADGKQAAASRQKPDDKLKVVTTVAPSGPLRDDSAYA